MSHCSPGRRSAFPMLMNERVDRNCTMLRLLPSGATPLLCGLAVGLWISGAALAATPTAPVVAIQSSGEMPEDALLDVGIQIFDPGLPPGDSYTLEEDGIYEDIRKSESRFIPVELMNTLQATGNWGAVRVVPAGTDSIDLVVRGRIEESSGRKLVLNLQAVDASGRTWLEKRYKHVANPRAYKDEDFNREPFQDIFNRIANDLLAARDKLDVDQLRRVRSVANLKFAADLAPIAYADYLGRDRKGNTVALKLPAQDDPMMERVAQVRERDYLFVDTLTEYYANFHAEMSDPYDNWRQFSYDEEVARRKQKRTALLQTILGAAGILGGLVVDGDSDAASAARQAAIIGGSMAVQMGMNKFQEVKLHVEALRELASSFDSEVAPLLIDVEGRTLRLTGSVETQYATWRQLMRDFFIAETGLPIDPDTGTQLAGEEASLVPPSGGTARAPAAGGTE